MSSRTPRAWPTTITFITTLRYHNSVPPSTRSLLTGNAPPSPCGVSHLVRIKCIMDTGHPAYGQHGLFAHKKIPPRSHIIDYVGEVHCEERPDSDYDLSLYRRDGVNVGIDAKAMGNESRFISDYRGIKARPNAEFVEYRTELGELRMSVWSREGIQRGDELVVSYGKSWWKSRSNHGND